jgi:hypothetical protein
MADERKISTHEIDRLYDFLDGLQASGYKIDPRQYMALSDLLMALVAHGELLENVSLKTLIAPIVCSTPADQQDFYQRFERWYPTWLSLKQTSLSETKLTLAPRPRRRWSPPKINQSVVIGILVIISLVLFLMWQRTSSGTGTGVLGNLNSNPVFYGLLMAFVGLLSLLVWRVWNIYQENQYITRELTSQEPVYTKIPVQTYFQSALPVMQFKPIVSSLRRRNQVPSNDVDVDRTIEAALQKNNWLEIMYRQRQVMPEYLVLIDRKSHFDQQARFVQEVLAKLAADGVWIHLYEFSDDPRICFPIGRKDTPLQLKDLQSRHPETRLLVFSGMSELINPLTGQLQDWLAPLSHWQERAILTADTMQSVLLDELQSREFAILPMTLDGIAALARTFEAVNVLSMSNGEPNLPPRLIERPMLWTGRAAPSESEVTALVDDVRRYLGEAGFYWLCASAVYPQLRWELTLYLGSILKGNQEQPLLDPDNLLRIARLPWFRYGHMPNWMRLKLVNALTAEQETCVRAVLGTLLSPSDADRGFDLEIAQQIPQKLSARTLKWIHAIIRNSPANSAERDAIFVKFILRKEKRRLAVTVPSQLLRYIKRLPSIYERISSIFSSPIQAQNLKGYRISQRGLLSITMLLVSIGALGVSLLSGVKLISDILSAGGLTVNSLGDIGLKVVVIGLAYTVGWITAIIAIRVYGNLILPTLINWMVWGCLAGVCTLYVLILQRLYQQGYDLLHYWAYLSMVGAGLGAMVGLHLIIEDHDLRPFSVPLLIISLMQMGLIVYRYVFSATGDSSYLWKDLLFFLGMIGVSVAMLADWGLLKPVRAGLTNYFNRDSFRRVEFENARPRKG